MFEWESAQLQDLSLLLSSMRLPKECYNKWIWKDDGARVFLMKLACKAIHDDYLGSQETDIMRSIWSVNVRPNEQFLLWRMINRLPTKDNLRYGILSQIW